MELADIRSVANAILYEGYMLYPYRPSALKNRSQGWTFGTLLPVKYALAHPGEAAEFRAEVLVTGAEAQFSAEIRFLHLCGSDTLERSVSVCSTPLADLVTEPVSVPFALPETIEKASACYPLKGMVRISAERAGDTACRIRLAVCNHSSPALAWDTRDDALRQALVSAHALLTTTGGEFVSLLNPPAELRGVAESCRQTGVFPVLAGEEPAKTAMLVSPIILYDYPKIAASSHGDFFDSSEIDEMLTLRVLTLTDEEKQEMRSANDRARALLQRTESLSQEDILSLHGVLRGLTGDKGER